MRRAWLPLLLLAACSADLPQAPCPSGTVNRDGSCARVCTGDTDCLLSQSCASGVCVAIDVPRPAILSFGGPTEVAAGASFELTFEAALAEALEVRAGAGPGQLVAADARGLRVDPISATTTFVLVARSASGQVEARHTVRLEGDPNPLPVRVDVFSATPARLDAPGMATLTWTVSNPTGPIRIVAGQDVVVAGGEPSGRVEWKVEQTTAFALSAPGFPSPALASTTVEVAPSATGRIVAFSATPSTPQRPRGVLLRWETDSGLAVRLLRDDMTVVMETRAPLVRQGAYVVAMPNDGAKTRWTLVLEDESGEVERRTLEVEAAMAPPLAPRIVDFDVNLDRTERRSTTLNVSWAAEPATAQVRLLTDDGSRTVGQRGQLQLDVTVERNLALVLEVTTPGGVAEARRVVARLRDEGEENDEPDEARELEERSAAGTVSGPRDEDWFWTRVPSGGQISVRSLPPCASGLRLRVEDAQGQLLGQGTARNGGCVEVEAPTSGDIYLRVDRAGLSLRADYAVLVDARGPVCGDGRVGGNETCDDGNRLAFDGCSARCTIEPGYAFEVDVVGSPGPTDTNQALPLWPDAGAVDAGWAVVDLGQWLFPFFGESYAGLEVHVDGFISFTRAISGRPDHEAISLFDDAGWRLGSGGRVSARTVSREGEPAVVLGWVGLVRADGQGPFRLEAELRRSGEIRVRYPEGLTGTNAFVGLRPRSGAEVIPEACNGAGCTGSELAGREIRYRPR